MSIVFNPNDGTFTLNTINTTYQMQINEVGCLRHLYYGRYIPAGNLAHQLSVFNIGFSPNPYELKEQRNMSIDVEPMEYSTANTGDFRVSAMIVATEDGRYGSDLRYVSHEITPGKYALEELPAAWANEDDCDSLTITLRDAATDLQVDLLYAVYESEDVITRAARIVNMSDMGATLARASSMTLDIPFGDWQLIHFHGRHAMERQMERVDLMHGIQSVSSTRGASSHQHNPFVILCDRDTTEVRGECYGVMPVYSGNHRTDIERDQTGCVRLVTGISPTMFRWKLAPNDAFITPEVILTFTHEGLGALSRRYHRFLRKYLIRSSWNFKTRPVLINNWEATYFKFNTEKILNIARQAHDMGVELMVLDDGWFGCRDDDNRALGDWFVNEEKLPGGLDPLIKGINDMGMRFGIWVEPEMVSEDSNLYRAHPDWALTVPGRKPAMGRNQLVLDMSRAEVVEYLYVTLSGLLRKHHIEYVKWDMNRNMTDVYSHALPPEKQGEVFHRYMLGVYALLTRLTDEFPHVLWEGCAGGGGRYDAGMLRYFPQIWLSDDTDALERLSIQHGSSFGYPISTVGAHVSACPNHQTGRTMPLGTRAVVAMSGTFGYELDPSTLTDEEKAQVRSQIDRFKRWYDIIQNGDYYRLTRPGADRFMAWQFVSPDKRESLVNVVTTHSAANLAGAHFRLQGLNPNVKYKIVEVWREGCVEPVDMDVKETSYGEGQVFYGAELMYAGYTPAHMAGSYPSTQLRFSQINE